MRVQFDTHLLDALSKSHPSHVSYVRNVLLPSLRNFWSEALSVVPAGSIEVPLYGDSARCASEVKETSGLNLDDLLQFSSSSSSEEEVGTAPSSPYYSLRSSKVITNVGADGNVRLIDDGATLLYDAVDLVVIVVPVEGTAMCPESEAALPEYSGAMHTLAFATNCQHDQFDRPTVGYTGICFGPLVRRRRFSFSFSFAFSFLWFFFPFRTPRERWGGGGGGGGGVGGGVGGWGGGRGGGGGG